ncbi:hypothetical protein FACS1894122_12570 [Alphaproteobacteria bacterium]|nr:hypothetical protein FACS1894122_12570 [Alphaproteobacteria bacterium]
MIMNLSLNLLGTEPTVELYNAGSVWGACAIAAAMFLTVFMSFLLSKKFVNLEFEKLKDELDSMFDQCIILASGAVASVLIVIVSMSLIGAVAKNFIADAEVICDSYLRLMIIFSALLTINYTIAAPSHANLGWTKLALKDSKRLYLTIRRVLVLSFSVTIIIYPIVLAATNREYRLLYENGLTGLVILFYFIEMVRSDQLICDVFHIKKASISSMSSKITTFINGKFVYLALAGMIAVVVSNHNVDNTSSALFFVNINGIFSLLFEMFAAQIVIVCIVNKFFAKLEEIEEGSAHFKASTKRMENLVWICDIIVLVCYLLMLCFLMKLAGIDIDQYIFHDKIVTVAWIIFITTILYKGFHEFKEAILERAKAENKDDYTKLQTFFPTISVLFHLILFLVATLLGLSNFNINVTPILAAFSVFSAAIGLAAKDVIQSFLQGVVFLVEKNLYVGEYVEINGIKGSIEKLSLRVIHLRCDNGSVHVIPYHFVNALTNYSKDYFRHFDDLRVSCKEDVDTASKILREIVNEMKTSEKFEGKIIGDVAILGVRPFDLTGIKIFWQIVTVPGVSDTVLKCYLYDRLMNEFAKQNITIPKADSINAS